MVRAKNRYLVLEVNSAPGRPDVAGISLKELKALLLRSLQVNYGDWGAGTMGPSLSIKYYNPPTGLCIIRADREFHRYLLGAATLLSEANGRPIRLRCLHISGTLRCCREAILHLSRKNILDLRVVEEALAKLPPDET